MRWLANPNQDRGHFPHDFKAHVSNLFNIKVKISMLIKWSYTLPIMFTSTPRTITMFCAHRVEAFIIDHLRSFVLDLEKYKVVQKFSM